MRALIGTSSFFLLLLAGLVNAANDEGLVSRWQFDREQIEEKFVKATAGPLDAMIVGPVRFDPAKPGALILDGDAKNQHRIDVTDDLAAAGLPTRALTVEAWVRIDKPARTGGIAGVLGGKGNDLKGWLLGASNSQFAFGLASSGARKFTTVKARTTFQTGYWYHVVGSYDGKALTIFVDGKLQGQSVEANGDIVYPEKGHYTIGAYRNGAEIIPLTGQLDQVSVYDRSFSTAVAVRRFNESKTRFPDTETFVPAAVDWPTYLRDSQRTGISKESLKFPLRLQWVHKTRLPPSPSWPEEAKNDYWHKKFGLEERVTFDQAFHLVGVGDRIYFGSSADGQVRCLDADTGRQRWSFTPEGPVRLAPTIVDDHVLFGSDDGQVYCLQARDGTLVWKQQVAPETRRIPGNGRIISAWPVRTDVLVDEGKAYVCAGVFPSQGVFQATLDVRDGKVLEMQPLGVTAQGYLERASGKLFVATGRNPAGAFVSKLKRMGKEIGKEVSNLTADYPNAFIGAGEVRIGGGAGKIAAFSVEDGTKVWSAEVEGTVWSLAVVRGRLLASTDKGFIYCFTADGKETKTVEPPPVEFPDVDAKIKAEAERIIRQSGAIKGYCLVLGSGDGKLICELTRRAPFQVIGREQDPAKVAEARRRIEAAGLAGRVAIHQGDLETLPYADYLFNVVVHDLAGEGKARDETLRVLRPAGGVAILGPSETDVVRRGSLAGAGEWSHMYGDPGNTACSGDERVSGPFAMQWFGPPGPRSMIDRHHRTAAPLYKNGRLFIPGEDRVVAVDAYNGAQLWDREVPGSRRVVVFRDSSHIAAADDALYFAAADRCLALDPQTGETRRTFHVPSGPGGIRQEWGYLAVLGDVLLASAQKPGSTRRTQSYQVDATEAYWDFVPIVASDFLFALDRKTGDRLWSYRPKSGLVVNPTIAATKETAFFIESSYEETLRVEPGRARLAQLLGRGSNLVALDLKTGAVRWSKAGPFEALQHNAYLCCARDKVIVVGSRNGGKDKNKDTVFYDIHVFDAATGERQWFQTQNQNIKIGGDHGEQDQHPVIVGDKLYVEPFAYDLNTGDKIDWKWPWTTGKRSGCGGLSASAKTFFFRNDTVSLFDLTSNQLQKVTTETRPGCWINLIPAGGLLLAPEASAGCSCNYSVQTSLALVPVKAKPGK